MSRWTEADVQAYEARTVGPAGVVNRHATPTAIIVRKKKLRYTNKPTEVDGIRFDSLRELKRYKDLKLMQDARAIDGLGVHPRYDLTAHGVLLGYVELDFEYVDLASGRLVVEDVKDPKKNSSTRTAIYKWKRRHLKAEHGIEIVEITA